MKILPIIFCVGATVLAGCSGGFKANSNLGQGTQSICPTATQGAAQNVCPAQVHDTVYAAPVTKSTTCVTQVKVTWTPPTTNTDGCPLTNLAGFNIYYGTSAHTLITEVNVPNKCATEETILNLPPDSYYFVMTAYNTEGLESTYSFPVATKTLLPCTAANGATTQPHHTAVSL